MKVKFRSLGNHQNRIGIYHLNDFIVVYPNVRITQRACVYMHTNLSE